MDVYWTAMGQNDPIEYITNFNTETKQVFLTIIFRFYDQFYFNFVVKYFLDSCKCLFIPFSYICFVKNAYICTFQVIINYRKQSWNY